MGAPGCDDAPVVTVDRAPVSQRDVTVIYPYYENPKWLAHQARLWAAYPDAFRTNVSIIVVDDCSPSNPARTAIDWKELNAAMFGNVRLFRINVDVRWNWLAARNIGQKHAHDQWRLMTDIDHVVPIDTMRAVIFGKLDRETIYRFSRIGTKTHPHPNSWLMTGDMFWKIGGYDEECSGYYGTDGDYRRRCAAAAPIRIMSEPLDLHEHEMDSSTTHYQRKQPEDAVVKHIIRARPKTGWKPKVLSFPYAEVRL